MAPNFMNPLLKFNMRYSYAKKLIMLLYCILQLHRNFIYLFLEECEVFIDAILKIVILDISK